MLKIKKGSYSYTEEWIMKEYGSWEDHNNDKDHVCAIVQRENATKSSYFFITKEEAKTLLKSAEYQYSAGWDGWDNPMEKQWFEKCMNGYADRIKKALNTCPVS
jgi:hypothetical protein